MTISDLAERAGVSQPSVTRFCRSVGCTSFSEFKVLLATTLTVAAVYLRTDRVFDDDVGQVAQVVMLRASNAIRDCLEKLDTVAVKHAIAAIAQCNRLDIYGQGGGSASIAEDAKLRFFRLGLPVCAYADGHQQRMSAATLRPKDVAFAVSNSGRSQAGDRRRRDRPIVWSDDHRAYAAEHAARGRGGGGHYRRHTGTRERSHADRFALRAYGGGGYDRDGRRLGNGSAITRSAEACALRAGQYRHRNSVAVLGPDAPDDDRSRRNEE